MKKKILLVDDDIEICELIEVSLMAQFELKTGKTGQDALKIVETFTPDLVILDIKLPDLSGYEICRRIKKVKGCEAVPIIFLSGKTGSEARTMGYELGAVNYLEKPFSTSELSAMVSSTLQSMEVSYSSTLHLGPIKINIGTQEVLIQDTPVSLTSSEFKIFFHLCKKSGEIIDRDYLFEVVAGYSSDVGDRIIDAHISSIRKKIKHPAIVIKSVYGKGYRLYIVEE